METETRKNVYRIHVRARLCNGCGDCVTACPINERLRLENNPNEELYTLRVRNGKCEVVNLDACDGCGVCVEACSTRSLKLELVEEW
ncbi:MAG: 4Fe-4S dicluster domain-containing protein [Candidatus Jordarchaeaceae archaeon]